MATVTSSKRVAGMGSILHDNGVAFRVWAPHADSVSVVGDFNQWQADQHEMESEGNGYWYTNISEAAVGNEYKYHIVNGEQQLNRIDPYAREVTNSVGNSIVHDPAFDWTDDDFQMPSFNEIVIYEMHIGTFNRSDDNRPGRFRDCLARLGYLKKLGVNVVEIMPVAEFAGDWSWGYNPAHIFAIEQAYGGPLGFKKFVNEAHKLGIAVVLDVVFNHFGPSDLDLWQFDGWTENDGGGIYFYNDWRANTPWGATRPDYGRGEVRQFIYDNATMWLTDYHVDGLRYDMTAYIRRVNGIDSTDIPEGWSLMQWINSDIAEKFPGKLLVAEDLQSNEYLTRNASEGGAGFSTQWDGPFVHPVRECIEQPDDASRNLWKLRDALAHRYNIDSFERVVYSESHDEIANGKSRVPSEVSPDDPDSVFAQKRAVLGAALALTAPGIPMLMQGQEFLEDGWFDDGDPLDWDRAQQFKGITRLFHDLIRLRLNREGVTRGLTGQHINVHHVNDNDKVIAYHRWSEGGAGDDVIVVMNFANRTWDHYELGFPREGNWQLRFNSDWTGYSQDFDDHFEDDQLASPTPRDGCPASAPISLGAYSILIFSQEEAESD